MVPHIYYLMKQKGHILQTPQDPKANTTEIPTGFKDSLKTPSNDYKDLDNQSQHCRHSKQAADQNILYKCPNQVKPKIPSSNKAMFSGLLQHVSNPWSL